MLKKLIPLVIICIIFSSFIFLADLDEAKSKVYWTSLKGMCNYRLGNIMA